MSTPPKIRTPGITRAIAKIETLDDVSRVRRMIDRRAEKLALLGSPDHDDLYRECLAAFDAFKARERADRDADIVRSREEQRIAEKPFLWLRQR